MSEVELAQKSKKWAALQGRRYGGEHKTRVGVDSAKALLPAEHSRKLMKDRGDLSNRKYRVRRRLLICSWLLLNDRQSDKRSHLGGLRWLPHAVLKILENMPMPWCVR